MWAMLRGKKLEEREVLPVHFALVASKDVHILQQVNK